MIIGLDGGEPSLIERWIDQLPNIKYLRENGAYGLLRSTLPPVTVPAWCSFYTGKNPAKTGVFDFRRRVENKYKEEFVNRSHVKSSSLWDIIGKYGKKSIIVNVPQTYPPKDINGILITGMLTPPGAKYCSDDNIRAQLDQICHTYVVEAPTSGDNETLLKLVLETARKRTKAFVHLITKYEWNLAVVVYRILDRLKHHHLFWRASNPSDDKSTRKEDQKYSNVIEEAYKLVDEEIAKILSVINLEDEIVVVMSDHGFGSMRGWFHVNQWLRKNNYLKLKKNSMGWRVFLARHNLTAVSIWSRLVKTGIIPWLSQHVSANSVHRLIPLKPYIFEIGVDWKTTRAYAFGSHAGIYINVEGREPEGIVKRGKEYEELREEILYKLSILRDENNESISKAYRREIYHGSYIESAPDILLSLEEGWVPVSTLSRETLVPAKSGEGCHTQEGIWIISGQKVKRGCMNVDITDLAPTILYLLDVPIPEDMDGKVIPNCIIDGHEVKYSASEETSEETQSFAEKEREEIRRRLRSLGYIG